MPADSGLPTHEDLVIDSVQITELRESKDRLLGRVRSLKTELTDWRGKLDEQMSSYRTELSDLRKHLHSEVDALRGQFSELQSTIKTQLEATARLADEEGSAAAKAMAGSAVTSDGI